MRCHLRSASYCQIEGALAGGGENLKTVTVTRTQSCQCFLDVALFKFFFFLFETSGMGLSESGLIISPLTRNKWMSEKKNRAASLLKVG